VNRVARFWQELKRRNVVRRNAVYAATAFVILELMSIIVEPLGLPDWTLLVIIILLSIGFIISIIFSWIYETGPDGGLEKTKPTQYNEGERQAPGSSTWKIASFISFIVIIGLIVLNVIPRFPPTETDQELEKSIAVLPFENMSNDAEDAYFGDAMTDEIIMQLYKIDAFEVRSRTSVMQYKTGEKTTPTIGDELKVKYMKEAGRIF
jgi:adenylate cyclase